MASKHGIRIPGLLLDELKSRDYSKDDRFNEPAKAKGKKRNPKGQLGRKERRKQQRLEKKSTKKGKTSGEDVRLKTKEIAKAKPSKVKYEESAPANKKSKEIKTDLPFSSDDELSSGDFDEFDEDDLDEEEWEQLRELEGEVGGESDETSEVNEFEEEEDLDDEELSEDGKDHDGMSVEETMAALKAMKQKKVKKMQDKEVVEEVEDEDMDEDEGEDEDHHENNLSEEDEESGDKEMSVEETMAALKAMKAKKNKMKDTKINKLEEEEVSDESEGKEISVEETMAALKAAKENKKKTERFPASEKKDKKKPKSKVIEVDYPMAPSDRAAAERDEMDMQYYAKKLGLKGKSKKIHARDEFDAIGGLLDGLDYFDGYGAEDEDYGEYAYGDDRRKESSDEEQDGEEVPAFGSDDELSSGDFDEFDEDDLDEEEWEQLRELEERDDESGDDEKAKIKGKRVKENPLVAPIEPGTEAYVPPSLRKKMLEGDGESAVEVEVKKSVKSSLNKLSDSNLTVIISALNDLYAKHARQIVTKVIIDQVIDIIGQRNKLLDSFIINYSAILYSLWRLRGTETGASFIQSVVESFLNHFEEQITRLDKKKTEDQDEIVLLSKEPANLLSLLAYCYNFGLISSKLIYDLIRIFVEAPNELTTELLLRIISISGSLIRGDDPSALKDIISVLLTNIKSIEKQPPRMKFLLDTVSDLKNNRLKPSMVATSHQNMKKSLNSFLNVGSTSSEALLVSLDDIKNVDTKGKWWLIGASWKGNMDSAFEEAPGGGSKVSTNGGNHMTIDDDLLDDTPDWSEIARRQRMNTDIRRAIFISIMSAQDYMDAFTKLEKLNLKKKQALEIPRVILHCLSQDGASNGYNPYYAALTNKLCENQHGLVKSFQFQFWEIVKAFEDDGLERDVEDNEDLDEDRRLKKIANQGKFFGSLIAEGTLKLDVLKHVSLISGLTSDGVQFMELLLFQMLLSAAKRSEVKTKDANNKKSITYRDDILHNILANGIKSENRPIILKGLRFFLKKHFKYKNYIAMGPGDKSYDRDTRRLKWAVSKFAELIDEELENADY